MDDAIVDPEPAAAPEQAEAAAPQGAASMRGKRKVLTALRNVDNSDAAAAKKTKQKKDKTDVRQGIASSVLWLKRERGAGGLYPCCASQPR